MARDFPGGPEVKILHFRCRGEGSPPGQGTKILHAAKPERKKKKKRLLQDREDKQSLKKKERGKKKETAATQLWQIWLCMEVCVSFRTCSGKWRKCQVGQRVPGDQRSEAAPEVPWEADRETQEEGQRIQPGKRLARDKNYLEIKMRSNVGDTKGRKGQRQTQWAEQALRKTRTSGPQIPDSHPEVIWVFLSQMGCMSQWQRSMCNTCCKSSI